MLIKEKAMKFYTCSGSIYEVDQETKRIRRLIGTGDPTTRQGKDGEWRAYERLDLEVGESAWIFWNPKTTSLLEGNAFGGTPTTVTSPVVNIERKCWNN
jgi:hypothetical protein